MAKKYVLQFSEKIDPGEEFTGPKLFDMKLAQLINASSINNLFVIQISSGVLLWPRNAQSRKSFSTFSKYHLQYRTYTKYHLRYIISQGLLLVLSLVVLKDIMKLPVT